MKNKAFTIIEVLVAVIILATVATALFQISINSKNNFSNYKNKYIFENLCSLSLFNNKKSNTNLYEQIRKKYKIEDDDLRRKLKSIKIIKKENIITTKKYDDFSLTINNINLLSKNGNTLYHSIGTK